MPRRPHLTLLLAGLLLATGCGTSRADEVTPATRTVCRIFLRDLPATLADQRRASVDRDALSATYGKPAIRLTCGVDRPTGFRATSTCQVVGDVGWFVPPDQLGQTPVATTLTSVGRRPRIRLDIPQDYWPSTAALVDIAGDVRAHLTKADTCS